MTIDDKFKDEKLQYNINREAAKISALSSVKIDKYQFLTGEDILPSDQSRIMEQAKFTYPLNKTFVKQIKTIDNQAIKQVQSLKALKNKEEIKSCEGIFPKDMRINEIENEINEIKKQKKELNKSFKISSQKIYIYDFQQYITIKYLGDNICTGKINIDEGEMYQNNLLKSIGKFNNKSRPRTIARKDKKEIHMKVYMLMIFMKVEN